MGLAQEKLYTTEFIFNLPEGERAELIDGRIYYMATPNRQHQRISTRLSAKILNYIDSKNGDCEVYAAPFAVFLSDDDRNYVEPDISVICDSSKLNDKGCVGAPDWIVEIVSPASKRMDYLIKLIKYKNSGVREYWIVDPSKEQVTVYNFELDDIYDYTFNDKIKVCIYENFEVDFSDVVGK